MCKKQIIIIGAGGHGRVVADIAKLNGYSSICFLDDHATSQINGYDVVGKVADFSQYLDTSLFCVAIGDGINRKRAYDQLYKAGAEIVSLVHPSAVVSDTVVLGKGVVIMAGTVINDSAQIGDGVIVNTSSSIDHDCVIGAFCHVSVGAHLAGTVHVGENTMIGAGAVVINNITVCANCVVGAGAVVIKPITKSGTYVGVPARKI